MKVDWSTFQKCPVCDAPLGEPCVALAGVIVGSTPLRMTATRPHTGRKLRVGR